MKSEKKKKPRKTTFFLVCLVIFIFCFRICLFLYLFVRFAISSKLSNTCVLQMLSRSWILKDNRFRANRIWNKCGLITTFVHVGNMNQMMISYHCSKTHEIWSVNTHYCGQMLIDSVKSLIINWPAGPWVTLNWHVLLQETKVRFIALLNSFMYWEIYLLPLTTALNHTLNNFCLMNNMHQFLHMFWTILWIFYFTHSIYIIFDI